MRIAETFIVAVAPEAVFDYMPIPQPRRLADIEDLCRALTAAPPGLGTRVRAH
jgi:hypothetical protein